MEGTELPSAAERLWYAAGAAGMLAGAAAVLAWLRGGSRDAESHHVTHPSVMFAAFTAYPAMAFGQGSVVGDARSGLRPFHYARYVDWAFTTPALLFALSTAALGSAARRPARVAGLLLADLFKILTGVFASLSAEPVTKWTWYAVSCGFFAAVLALA